MFSFINGNLFNLPKARKATFVGDLFNTMKTKIEVMNDQGYKSLLITSSLNSEVQPLISTNLAFALAKSGKSTVYIDCHLRNPQGHHFLKCQNSNGLSDFLAGEVNLSSIVNNSINDNLYVITAGTDRKYPSDLITSVRMKYLLDRLKDKVDYIIVDSPPVNFIETTSLAANTDASILVTNITKVSKKQIKESKEHLTNCSNKVLGVVGFQ